MKTFRRKGLEFEKEVSRILSKWISSSDKLIFWRTHGSGSASKLGKNFEGDITSIEPEGENFVKIFYIECKRYKNFDVASFFDEKSNYEMKIVKEYINKAKSFQKHLFLLVKRNFSKKTLLFFEVPQNSNLNETYIILDGTKLIITTLEDFVSKYKPEFVISLWGFDHE